MINYHYDAEIGHFELYAGDVLIVELPHADKMTEQECEALAQELWTDYLNAQEAKQ